MAVGTTTALAAMGGGALLGGIAGSMGQRSETNYDSNIDAGQATGAELFGGSVLNDNVRGLQGLVNAGPGQQDVSSSLDASRGLAAMLEQYSQTGGLPGSADISTSNNIANSLFQARQLGLNQAFSDQNTAAQRQAALMGRDGNDPILRAKLAQEQTRQQGMLGAEQGAWAQQFALQLPGQRLGYAQNRASLLGGLATQAMANRQALAAMGEGIQTNERNFRLQTARRYGTQATESGGGLQGAITGALGGAGALAGIAGGFGGGGQAGGFNPAAATQMVNGFAGANSYMSGVNPFSVAGPGLQYQQPQQNMFAGGGGFQMGTQFNGQPRNFGL